MPSHSFFGRIANNPKIRRWSYRSSLIFFIVFFAGFCSVIPIDSIVQASESSNYALNTFVVVGALVLFGVTGIVLTISRIYIQRSALQDIPKRYVPLDDGDLPKECDVMVNENFKKCEHIRSKALDTDEDVKHPGLSGPKSELLPPSLSFEEVVRAIGDRLKWGGALIGTDYEVPSNSSFREIVAYLEEKMIATDYKLNREYVELYEELRFSGDLIDEEKFIKFMKMSIEFVKITRLNMGESLERRYSESELSRSSTNLYSKLSLPRTGIMGSISNNASWLAPPVFEEREPIQTQEEYNHYHDLLKRVGTGQTVLSFRSGKEGDDNNI